MRGTASVLLLGSSLLQFAYCIPINIKIKTTKTPASKIAQNLQSEHHLGHEIVFPARDGGTKSDGSPAVEVSS